MNASVHVPPRANAFDRIVGWILDPDGIMYGDERERLSYYESSTVVASLHSVLVPWTLLACAMLGGRPVAPVVAAVAIVFMLPWIIGSVHVRRRRVRIPPSRITKTYVATFLLVWVPYTVVLLVLVWQFTADSEGGFSRGFRHGAIGGAIGGAIAGVVGLYRKYRAAHRPAPVEDDE